MIKIPNKILKQFIMDNFKHVKTSTQEEIRINSIYECDNKFHLYINLEKLCYICYKSGSRGSVLSLIKEYLNLDTYQEVSSYLFKNYFSLDDDEETKTEQVEVKVNPKLELPPVRYFDGELGPKGQQALKYLTDRGFSRNKIIANKIGYIITGDYFNRVFIPFYEKGQLVYFIARDFIGGKLRYKNPTIVNSKDFVFNFDKLEGTIGVTEGVFDAMYLEFPIATSMLSNTISDMQVEKILSKPVENIILILDNDKAAKDGFKGNFQKFASKSVLMDKKVNFYVYVPKNGKDINEAKINYINISDCKRITKSMIF